MEALYMKLYEKYSKLKNAKESEMDQINRDQEAKFMEFVSAAESMIKHLTAENNRLTEDLDELRNEIASQRNAKDQEILDFQQRWIEGKQKIRQLSAELEQLRNLQQEMISSRNRSDQSEERVNGGWRSPTVSCSQTDESLMRMTRKRARLFQETNLVTNSPTVGHVEQSMQKDLSTDESKRDNSKAECCQGIVVDGGAYKCMFHVLFECLIGMKLSISDQPDENCIRFAHQSSGYSFSLTWLNEGELMYDVISIGTLANVGHEWMKDTLRFGMNMCPVFFERLSRVIKRH
ncbi:hypothetical protein vseg_009631 [Gypsophila vaccaria]